MARNTAGQCSRAEKLISRETRLGRKVEEAGLSGRNVHSTAAYYTSSNAEIAILTLPSDLTAITASLKIRRFPNPVVLF